MRARDMYLRVSVPSVAPGEMDRVSPMRHWEREEDLGPIPGTLMRDEEPVKELEKE